MTILKYKDGHIDYDETKYVGGCLSEERSMQAFYVITGRNEGKWYIESFDGESKKVMFSENHKKTGSCRWDWHQNCLVFLD